MNMDIEFSTEYSKPHPATYAEDNLNKWEDTWC